MTELTINILQDKTDKIHSRGYYDIKININVSNILIYNTFYKTKY